MVSNFTMHTRRSLFSRDGVAVYLYFCFDSRAAYDILFFSVFLDFSVYGGKSVNQIHKLFWMSEPSSCCIIRLLVLLILNKKLNTI